MRFNSTFKIMLALLAFCIAVTVAIFYGANHLSDQTLRFIEDYAGAVFITIVGVFIIYVIFSAITTGANEYADGIFEIFLDSNDKDIHVFTYNRIVSASSSGGAARLIQHYFMIADTGKTYYKVLFSHRMDSENGVLDGFESFGKSVLKSQELKDRFKELSDKTGLMPGLGQILKNDENDLYKIGSYKILTIEKVKKLFSTQLYVVYMNADSKKVLWKNKI